MVGDAVRRASVLFDGNESFPGSRLRELTDEDFVAKWREIVGEPPSIMLEDRREMIAILVAASGSPAELSASREVRDLHATVDRETGPAHETAERPCGMHGYRSRATFARSI